MMRIESSWSVLPQAPNIIVPRQSLETWTPVRPSGRYSMTSSGVPRAPRGGPPRLTSVSEHVDVLIIGAGLSGIGVAWYLQRDHPGRSYALLEAREASGGTWDLFRYPGIRSDSDVATFAYAFKPWPGDTTLADGPEILRYLRDTARE